MVHGDSLSPLRHDSGAQGHAEGVEYRLGHADLRWADLRQANLSGASLATANLRWAYLKGAKYDQYTKLPAGFNPHAAWMVLSVDQ